LYENTTFFLMDTLMAQMIGVILIKKKKWQRNNNAMVVISRINKIAVKNI
jgi:hypothetical protein